MTTNRETSKKNLIDLLIEMNPCSKCKPFRVPICQGHGGGSGGGGGGGSEKSEKSQNTFDTSSYEKSLANEITQFALGLLPRLAMTNDSTFKNINENDFYKTLDIIRYLVEMKVLSIVNNPDIGKFEIKCNPIILAELKEDQKNTLSLFIRTIQNELNEFISKNKLGSDKSTTLVDMFDIKTLTDKDDRSLSLTILAKNIKYVDLLNQFVKHLNDKFLPALSMLHEKNNSNENSANRNLQWRNNPLVKSLNSGPRPENKKNDDTD